MRNIASMVVLMAASGAGKAATLYLSTAYSGGTFWASSHCRQHNALVERILSVPDGMSFQQQVELGQQQLDRLASPTGASQAHGADRAPPQPNRKAQCDTLDAKVKHFDALARQPQSGQMQGLDHCGTEESAR